MPIVDGWLQPKRPSAPGSAGGLREHIQLMARILSAATRRQSIARGVSPWTMLRVGSQSPNGAKVLSPLWSYVNHRRSVTRGSRPRLLTFGPLGLLVGMPFREGERCR
jgi:hypothetical protein